MSAVIRLQQVVKRYGRTLALDHVSLEVPRGVVFALLGENGAGKSTSIKVMLGLADADAGRSEILGLDSARDGLEIRRRVGYVAERPTLYEWMTVEEIGWFAAGFHGPNFLDEYRRLAERFQLPLDRKIKALSKGGKAKVALALAMGHDPELLVLDEPTSGLDTLVRHEFLDSMVDRAATGRTVLLSSHQIHEVERVADYVAIVRAGKVVLVEKLDLLKARTRELTISLDDASSIPPGVPGEILRQRRRDRQWQLLVQGDEQGLVERIQRQPSVVDVQCRAPSLEEIFVAYLKSDVADGRAAAGNFGRSDGNESGNNSGNVNVDASNDQPEEIKS